MRIPTVPALPLPAPWRALLTLALLPVALTAQKPAPGRIGTGLAPWQTSHGWSDVGAVKVDPEGGKTLLTEPGDGVLTNDGEGPRNLLSKREYGDVVVRVAFLVPAGSNSGILLQGRYEIQIADSFGKTVLTHADCGGIDERCRGAEGFEGHPPKVNASKAPSQWQTLAIVFRAPRFDEKGAKTENARFVSVRLNGVVVHENVEVTGPTRASTYTEEGPVGPLMFQGDQGPVALRRLRVREMQPSDLSPEWAPTKDHVTTEIEGFQLLVDPRLTKKPQLHAATLREVRHQLYQITRTVPAAALARLRKVRIFVEAKSPTLCMAYHPSRNWLEDHGHNPDLAGCVELGNPATFLAWTRAQPWMVLHELAHAYHHQFLPDGFGNKTLRDLFDAATASKTYEKVQHIHRRTVRAYALTNPQEYFAEASEAYFGTNDMYPFVNSELAVHDPKLYAALSGLWGR